MDSTKAQPFVCRVNSEDLVSVGMLLGKGPPYPADLVCPICRESVTLVPPNRLRSRGGYVRHRTGRDCARRPQESEVHEQAKNALVRTLNKTHAPFLCVGSPTRSEIYLRPLAWDRALPEVTPPGDRTALGYRSRADVGLISGDKLVYVLEVCEENPVSPLKAATFRQTNIPWAEVKARDITKNMEGAWGSLACPLPRIAGWDPTLTGMQPLFPPGGALS